MHRKSKKEQKIDLKLRDKLNKDKSSDYNEIYTKPQRFKFVYQVCIEANSI